MIRTCGGEFGLDPLATTMHRQSLFDADRAVTPVIGLVLVVALAVILASLVSIQAFGLFGVANDPGPTMDFTFNYNTSAPASAEDSWGTTAGAGASGDYDGILEITYQGGKSVAPERLTVLREGNESAVSHPVITETLEIGTTLRVWVYDETTLRVVWRDPGGEKTAAVAVWDDGE